MIDQVLASRPIVDANEPIYVGIDIGKTYHFCAFCSKSLLSEKTWDQCPWIRIPNERAGFEELLQRLESYGLGRIAGCLLENTGHYMLALQRFLEEHHIPVYKVQVLKRALKRKNDRRDSQHLAHVLYGKLVLNMQVGDTLSPVRKQLPPTETAIRLRGLVQYRSELAHELTSLNNQLTAIADQLFPEFTQALKDPCSALAIAIRKKWPTAQLLADADIEELVLMAHRARRPKSFRDTLERLKKLMSQSVGTKDPIRLYPLLIEQSMLIERLELALDQIATLEAEIEKILAGSREAKIIMSLGVVGPIMAASIIAGIGNIGNFESAAALKAYAGYAPRQKQTGAGPGSIALGKSGNLLLKQGLWMATWMATRMDSEWKVLYDRLVPVKCAYDKRTQSYRGKSKVLCRIAAQLINVIYVLLRADYDVLTSLPPGAEPPEPTLYSREIHRSHIHKGEARPAAEKAKKLSGPDQVRQLLEQDPGLSIKDIMAATGALRSTVSRTRRQWLKQHPDLDPATTPERQRIVDALTKYGPMALKALADRLGKNPNTTRNHLTILRNEGRVALDGNNIYRLVAQEEKNYDNR